jgi:CDP-6-deoxy-D-xylo-4-hexulose-3-dehydrase
MTITREAELEREVLDRVRELIELRQSRKPEFVPGETPIGYAGRIYDAEEVTKLVESSMEFWLTAGRFTREFETKLARWYGLRHASLVNSGSSANLAAFSAITSHTWGDRRVHAGDEVITVAAGFPTTVFPMLQFGAVPVFLDVTLPTYNIDVTRLEEALSPRTRAVFVAHTLGNPFDLDAVAAFCRKHDLWLVEDNCDANGSVYKGRKTGTIGDLATLSFYPPHHMTMGEGGAVMSNSAAMERVVNSFRDWGRDCWCDPGKDNTCGKRFGWQQGELPAGYDHKYTFTHLGYNLKATDMQAAIGVAQLDKLEGFGRARAENWKFYREAFRDLDDCLVLADRGRGAELVRLSVHRARGRAVHARPNRASPRSEENPDAHALRRKPRAPAGPRPLGQRAAYDGRQAAVSRGRRADEYRRHHEPQLLDRRLSRPHRTDARVRRGDDPHVRAGGSVVMPFISVVSGCFNEEDNVDELHRQVRDAIASIPDCTYEHIFIDNASTDRTVERLRALAAQDRNVKVIVNTRNFGHIRSPYHALLQARGDAVIGMASDLQDPPSLIPELVRKWSEGYKVVMAVKPESDGGWLTSRLRRAYYDILGRMSNIKLTKNFTGFGIYDQSVIAILRTIDDPYPYFRGLVADLGFEAATIEFRQPRRKHGITHNNFFTLYDLAMLGLTSYSKVPLRLATMLGFLMALSSFLVAMGYLVMKLLFWYRFSFGQAPLLIGIFFLGSVQLLFIGLIGEYIGAIHTHVQRRPLVIEKERINFDAIERRRDAAEPAGETPALLETTKPRLQRAE